MMALRFLALVIYAKSAGITDPVVQVSTPVASPALGGYVKVGARTLHLSGRAVSERKECSTGHSRARHGLDHLHRRHVRGRRRPPGRGPAGRGDPVAVPVPGRT